MRRRRRRLAEGTERGLRKVCLRRASEWRPARCRKPVACAGLRRWLVHRGMAGWLDARPLAKRMPRHPALSTVCTYAGAAAPHCSLRGAQTNTHLRTSPCHHRIFCNMFATLRFPKHVGASASGAAASKTLCQKVAAGATTVRRPAAAGGSARAERAFLLVSGTDDHAQSRAFPGLLFSATSTGVGESPGPRGSLFSSAFLGGQPVGGSRRGGQRVCVLNWGQRPPQGWLGRDFDRPIAQPGATGYPGRSSNRKKQQVWVVLQP